MAVDIENINTNIKDFHNCIDPEENLLNKITTESNYYNDETLCKTIKNNKGLSVVHFNARSLNANFRNIESYISQLEFMFDVITVSETWFAENTHVGVFNISGYELHYVSRNDGRGGGVAIYINETLRYRRVESKCLSVDDCFECLTMEIIINGSKNVIIACIYRKPDSQMEKFTCHLEELFGKIKNNKVLYITGDFNIDLIKQDAHSQTKHFIDTIFSMGLFPLITKPSRITNHSATLIDNIFTNNTQHKNISGLVINDITDHLPVFAVYGYKAKSKENSHFVYQRRINEQSIQRLNKMLTEQDWHGVFSQGDVNECYGYFLKTVESALNLTCPIERKNIKNRLNIKPWLTKGLINACKKKNAMYKTFLETKLQSDEDKYKKYKNKLTKILRKAEQLYYNEQITNQRNNIKGTWKILNKVIRGSPSTDKIPEIFINNNSEISDKKEIANGFNNFFVNVGPNLAREIKNPSNISVEDYMEQQSNRNTMFLDPVSNEEIIEVVKSMGNKTSVDCHDISMSLIKHIVVALAEPITHICNLSFETGVFPEMMKVAKVVPLFKSGEKNVFTNYRPVALLPQFSKILEKLFNNRLEKFLNKNQILSNTQYGFRENMSTSLALMELIEDITQSLDERKHTIGVFIDLKKAFDTIDHKILLKKLYYYGLRGKSNEWIKSYLESRKQYVKLQNCESDCMNVVCGVPQGSILGPKLFILYINDMCNVSNLLKFILFADDTNIFCSGKDLQKLSNLITQELYKLTDWFAANKLSLNVSKTNFMIFSNAKKVEELQVKINNTAITRVNATKFLGVFIDEKLNWKEHIKFVKAKLSKSMFMLNRAKHVLQYDAMLMLYNCIVLPHLTYCCELWGNTYMTNLQGIVIIQKKIMRIVHGASYTAHTNMLFYKAKNLKFSDLVETNMAVIMHKAYYKKLPQNVQNFFSLNLKKEEERVTRQLNKFKLPKIRTTLKGMCISTRGVNFWNSLDPKIIENNVLLHKFKRALKKMYLDKYLSKK